MSITTDEFLVQLKVHLEKDDRVQGVLLLGSTADPARRDQWSDYDFWIVSNTDLRTKYLDDYNWIPHDSEPILSSTHGFSYRTVVYSDQRKIDYAVWILNDMANAKVEKSAILFDRGGISELLQELQQKTAALRQKELNNPAALQNLGILLWATVQRSQRGEILSAGHFYEIAVDTFLNILSLAKPTDTAVDQLDSRRRLERRHPEIAARLLESYRLPYVQRAVLVLDLAERFLAKISDNNDMDKLVMVRRWCQEIIAC